MLMFLETAPPIDGIAALIDAQFVEMPGMKLTAAQVRRLWHLSESECEAVLGYLVDIGRLVWGGGGQYGRPDTVY